MLCSPGVPNARRGASTVIFFHYAEKLKESGYDVLHVLLLEPPGGEERALQEYVRTMGSARRFQVFPFRAERFLHSRGASFYPNPEAVAELGRQARSFRPDVIVCMDVLSAWILEGVRARVRLVWLGDLNFQTEWYHALYGIRERPIRVLHLPRVWARCQNWRRVYRRVLRTADVVVVSSKSSEHELGRLGLASQYFPYPWPSPTVNLDGLLPVRARTPTFVFLGNLVGLGSRSAFHFLTNRLYPQLVRAWGPQGFRILVCGLQEMPDWVRKAVSTKPEFEYLGYVEDLAGLLHSCHGALIPIDVPVGNRSRILTAMASGVPVIAHANTALGNPSLRDGVTCYLARTGPEFVAAMRRVVQGSPEVKAVVANARRAYVTQFHPRVAALHLVEALRQAEARAGASALRAPSAP